MKKLKFVVSLTTDDNDYQQEQASSAVETAARLGVDIELVYAENDAVLQSQQLLKFIQSNPESRPAGIVFEPVGATAMPQVARAAAAAGIGWVVLNRDVEYLADLRRSFKVPIFSITSDHEEIGRIQGKQIAALLPKGGSVLSVQGPAENLAAKQRATGMQEAKPGTVQNGSISRRPVKLPASPRLPVSVSPALLMLLSGSRTSTGNGGTAAIGGGGP